MEISSVLRITNFFAIIIPLVYAIYLFVKRINLSFVDKKILNNGCIIVSFISFLIFLLTYFLSEQNVVLNQEINYLFLDRFTFDFGICIEKNNLIYLIYSSFIALLVSIYSKYYFLYKKQFIFTKQRYYMFLSSLSFVLYMFLVSSNLIQGTMFLILESVLVFLFSYFDIFKNPTNVNITRFHRISLVGNVSLVLAVLILFRYTLLSKGYIESNSLNYDELNILASYMFGISSVLEFKIMLIGLIIATMTRLMIFPFSCYYSFFSNSSNILYLTTVSLVNNIVGIFLFIKVLPILGLLPNVINYIQLFLAVTILFSLFQLFFEKNIKIIFGYLISVLNSLFIILFLILNYKNILYVYFLANLILIIILMSLFAIDKINIKRRIINKQIGFALEKMHIVIFENLPMAVAKFVNFIDEKIIQNITYLFIKLINYIIRLFVYKVYKNDIMKNIRNILIVFALFAILAIFIALFGRF